MDIFFIILSKMLLLLLIIISIYILVIGFKVRIKRLKHTFFPEVSLLVYAKDAGNTIKRKIENFLSQNYPENKYEIIVYDNASSDETKKICEGFAKKGAIKYIRVGENKNLRKSYGKGTVIYIKHPGFDRKAPLLDLAIKELATGEIILMNDPDVVCEKNWILDMVQPFKNKQVGAVTGTVHCGNYYESIMTRLRAVEDEWNYVVTRMINNEMIPIYGANYGLRYSVWKEVGGHGTGVIEDVDIAVKIIEKEFKIVGVSASGVEEEVSNINAYWRQRTRWYKANIFQLFKGKHKIKKFINLIPFSLHSWAVISMYALLRALLDPLHISGFTIAVTLDIIFASAPLLFLHIAMFVAFIKIKTGRKFIPFIPLYLTVDALLFFITLIYVNTLGRFSKEVWPSLEGKHYHAGVKLKRKWFFQFENKERKHYKNK